MHLSPRLPLRAPAPDRSSATSGSQQLTRHIARRLRVTHPLGVDVPYQPLRGSTDPTCRTTLARTADQWRDVRVLFRLENPPVLHQDNPIRRIGDAVIVRHNQHRRLSSVSQAA